MLELNDASQFIEYFEKITERKVYRFPFCVSEGNKLAILMCKCNKTYISLPYLSQAIIETSPKEFDFTSLPKNWEIRDIQPHSNFLYTDKVIFEINLNQNYNPPTQIRRKIRKGKLNGIIVKQGTSEELLNDFYYVYSKRMHEIGVPPVSKKLIRKKLSINITQLFVAYKDNKPIGSATLDKLTSDYLENTYFATLSKFNSIYPSYALHNEMINYSKHKNASIYSLGRCTKGSSVYNYKKHWKAQETQLYWSHSTKFKTLRNNKWLFTIWKHLPYSLTILLGGIIHKIVY